MRDWRGIVRKVIGEPHTAVRAFSDLSLQLPKLFVLRPNEGLGKEFMLDMERLDQKVADLQTDQDAEKVAQEIFRSAELFSNIQRKQVETMVTDVTESADELLQKLSGFMDVQSDRVTEIEKIRSNIAAAQSAETLDGMRRLLNKGLDGIQTMVENELQRQKEMRVDHESYAARLQAKLETVEKESRTDSLTGVANRTGCMKKITSVLDYVKTNKADYRLVLLDLNGFKKINDTLGHAAGDATLLAFSQRLLVAVGKEAFVGRLAGDEFIVISNYSQPALVTLLQRLQEQFVTLPATYKGINLEISFCYGMSQINRNSDSKSVIEQADMMLYKSKNDFYQSCAA